MLSGAFILGRRGYWSSKAIQSRITAPRVFPLALTARAPGSPHRIDADTMASWSLRPLEHQLQSHTCGCARVRELQFLVGDGRDDPALIGRFGTELVSMLR
jgi:hypothetical protein